ncbi:MAG: DMT family transporter, partial [Bacteroidia bacterium]|nr:DMT family transporter [Bacteroidia bacterium]
LSLVPLIFIFPEKPSRYEKQLSARNLALWGTFAGVVLFAGASLQQMGMVDTTAGNGGFITGLYVIFVPLLGLFFRQPARPVVWLAATMAVTGMYLLTMHNALTFTAGDTLVLVSALFFALHVIVIGQLTGRFNALKLSMVQFFSCAVFSGILAFIFESFIWMDIFSARLPILYGGIISVGVGYTFQVLGQKTARPAPAAIILSMEAVFAMLGGMLILNETVDRLSLSGALLMFSGMVLAQWPSRRLNHSYKNQNSNRVN